MAVEEGFLRRVTKKQGKKRCGFEENGGYFRRAGYEWRERRGMV
jgi:hypothetical protein